MADIKLLDCTLRDGGYVNDWQWGFGQARRIIQTLTARALMWSRWAFAQCGRLRSRCHGLQHH